MYWSSTTMVMFLNVHFGSHVAILKRDCGEMREQAGMK